jgi:FtsZ-binding cell division protein ZapB
MRDHGDGTESTVSRDGVTVYQTYQEERFGVPTVVLKLVSERAAADVHLTVDLPPDLHIEEVGFHPDYRREDWSVARNRLTFETGLGPDEEVTTMYAVESLAADQLDALLDNLSIERVADASGPDSTSGFDPHPARRSDRSPGGATAADDAGDAAGEATAEDLQAQVETYPAGDDQEEVSAADVDFSTGPDETLIDPIESGEDTDPPTDDSDPAGADDAAAGSADADNTDDESEATDGESAPATGWEESPASDTDEVEADAETDVEDATEDTTDADELADYSTTELVAELDQRVQAGGFTDQDRERLYELLLGEAGGTTVSDELRVAHLQKRVSDLEASMEAVNEFDDQHGSIAEAFADLQAELASLDKRVDSIDRNVSRQADRIDALEDGQEALESEVSALSTWRERVRSTLGALGDE